MLGFQAHDIHQMRDALFKLLALRQLRQFQRFANDIEDGPARVKRIEGVLKDHIGVAPNIAQFPRADIRHVDGRFIVNLKLNAARGRVERAQDAAPNGGLARTRFADQAQRFARLNLQAHVVNRFHLPDHAPQKSLFDREVLLQALHFQQRLPAHIAVSSRWSWRKQRT